MREPKDTVNVREVVRDTEALGVLAMVQRRKPEEEAGGVGGGKPGHTPRTM